MKTLLLTFGLLLSALGAAAQGGGITITHWPADGVFPATMQLQFEQQRHFTARLHASPTMQGPKQDWPVIAFYDCHPERQMVSGWYPSAFAAQMFFATTGDNCNGPALVEWAPPALPDLLDNPMGL